MPSFNDREKMFKVSNQEMLFEMLFCSPQQSGTWEMKLITPTSKIRRALAYWRKETADEEPVGENAPQSVAFLEQHPRSTSISLTMNKSKNLEQQTVWKFCITANGHSLSYAKKIILKDFSTFVFFIFDIFIRVYEF